ncbi:putative histone H2A.2 isoform X1 [Cinnamomum micranthum f. kanehirae]|uniref:Putative histone H2A.2 isoform X1 n=1 Tax=Cinnamomum micranthum f. kanehirae TaxID=337451 RepID=A0A3S3N5M1_9MAGN|nr:putative histone H2A.2 isoform X1 [Cinnamomum micranthum f. kanehirae]
MTLSDKLNLQRNTFSFFPKTPQSSLSLSLSLIRIACLFKARKYTEQVGAGTFVYLTVVLEYLAPQQFPPSGPFPFLRLPSFSVFVNFPLFFQVLRLAGNAGRDNKKARIVPRHIQLAVRNDEELSKLLGEVMIANDGVMSNIHNLLLPKKAGASKAVPA